MRNYIMTFFLFVSLYSFQQNLEWLNYTTNSQDEIIKDMALDNQGNVIQLIESSFAPKTTLRKIDISGSQLWSFSLNVAGIAVDTDSNGNIFLMGRCSGNNVDLNPDPNLTNYISTVTNYTGGWNKALFIIKFNSEGLYQTSSSFGSYPDCADVDPGSCLCNVYPIDLKIDNNNDVLFSYSGALSFVDVDPSNNVVYSHSLGTITQQGRLLKWSNDLSSLIWGTSLYASGIAGTEGLIQNIFFDIDSQNNIYVATSYNGGEIWMSKLSSNGSLIIYPWETKVSGFGSNIICDLSILSDNEIILGGNFVESIDLNPIASNPSQTLSSLHPYFEQLTPNEVVFYSDAFVVKYDSIFNLEWSHLYSGQYTDQIEDIETYNGKIYVCGLQDTNPQGLSNTHWYTKSAYINTFDSNGNIIDSHGYISPWPQNANPASTFGAAFPINTVSTDVNGIIFPNWQTEWGKRTIRVLDDYTFYIGGEYSSVISSNDIYQMGTYSLGFDWDACNTIPSGFPPQNHVTGINTIPLEGFIRPYLAKYDSTTCCAIEPISSQPVNQTIIAGQSALFEISTSITSPSYQWQIMEGGQFININDFGQYTGSTTSTLIITNIEMNQNNSLFRCIVYENSSCSETSETCMLTVICDPDIIIDQPNDQTVNAGDDAQFSVLSNLNTLTYQWQLNNGTGFLNLSDAGQYSGTSTENLIIANTVISQNNIQIRCIVSQNQECVDTTSVAILYVLDVASLIENSKNDIIYFPNPTTDKLNIKSETSVNNKFKIVDQKGREIMRGRLTGKNTKVSLRKFPIGTYTIYVEGNYEPALIIKD